MPLAIVQGVVRRCRAGKLRPWEARLKAQRGLTCRQLGEAVAAIIENARKLAADDVVPEAWVADFIRQVEGKG